MHAAKDIHLITIPLYLPPPPNAPNPDLRRDFQEPLPTGTGKCSLSHYAKQRTRLPGPRLHINSDSASGPRTV